LETVVRRKDDPDSAACSEWWRDTHESYPLSKVIRESVSLEESSQRPLTALELITRLSKWKYFINAHPSITKLDDSDVLRFNTGTLLDLQYCRAFRQKDTEIPGQGRYVPERFFTYLLRTVFFRDLGLTPETVAQTERFSLAMGFQSELNAMINVVSLVDLDDSKKRRSIVHHALKAILTITDAEAQKRFLEGESPLPEEGTQKTTQQILEACEASLRALLGLAWEDSIQHELGRVVVLGYKDVLEALRQRLLSPAKSSSSNDPKMRPIIDVVPANNFYFFPDPVRLLTAHDREHLSELKKMIRSSDSSHFLGGSRDVSLFDSAGNKVWWGDLSITDIGNLQGPLYLLSQQDSYHSVPDWITLTSKPTEQSKIQGEFQLQVIDEELDLKPEATTLNCDYVRLRAVGKIVDGRWIENPKRCI
jgi:hypothetical protein